MRFWRIHTPCGAVGFGSEVYHSVFDICLVTMEPPSFSWLQSVFPVLAFTAYMCPPCAVPCAVVNYSQAVLVRDLGDRSVRRHPSRTSDFLHRCEVYSLDPPVTYIYICHILGFIICRLDSRKPDCPVKIHSSYRLSCTLVDLYEFVLCTTYSLPLARTA